MYLYIKIEKLIIKFGDIEIEKQKCHQHKGPIPITNIDIKKIRPLISNKVSFGKKVFKYFIGYKDVKRNRPLCIFLPKISAYRRDFDETKYICFLIKDDELLEKYNEIWEKVRNSMKKEFYSQTVYNEKYLKTKRKSYNGKINTNFHNNRIPKEVSQFISLSVILIDSVFRVGKNYYPQVFLEECKFVVKEKKMSQYITDDIETSSDDSDREECVYFYI